jgi:pSer/pThr/pTyr-binding forkhead associated (FHA) protein
MNNRNPDVNSNTLSPRARLLCLNQDLDTSLQGLEIVLSGQAQTIGRSSENTVYVPYQRISRNHARIFPERGAWWIEDLKSTNGVFINEERISRAALLRPGDIVKVGPIAFRAMVIVSVT